MTRQEQYESIQRSLKIQSPKPHPVMVRACAHTDVRNVLGNDLEDVKIQLWPILGQLLYVATEFL